MSNHPIEMFNYHTWATATILGRLKELPSSVPHQEVNSSFPTIAHALSHMYAIDAVWYKVLTGTNMREAMGSYAALNDELLDSVEAYTDRFAKLGDQFKAWMKSQSDLEQSIMLDNPFATVRETKLSEILLQAANHGTYHRGNITTMIRQLGFASTMNDYSLYWYVKEASK
jgi:uncharacterized damage-inducible protein DinB